MALTGSGAERAAAFSEPLDRSLDRSYRLAATILGNQQEGEDATHDAALRAWTAVPSLRDPAKFDAWFQRILVNVCRNRLRARRRPLILEADRAQSVDHQAASAERDWWLLSAGGSLWLLNGAEVVRFDISTRVAGH